MKQLQWKEEQLQEQLQQTERRKKKNAGNNSNEQETHKIQRTESSSVIPSTLSHLARHNNSGLHSPPESLYDRRQSPADHPVLGYKNSAQTLPKSD